jgi:hypothetical protein
VEEDMEEDMEEDEDQTCERGVDDDIDMNDIDDETLSKVTHYAYKHNNKVSYVSII